MAATSTEERERRERQERQAQLRQAQTLLNAQLAREQQEREEAARRRQQEHERYLAELRRRELEARTRQQQTAARQYTSFTPPQSFIAGTAASRVSGAPGIVDVGVAIGSAVVATAWAITRDHQTSGDLGWAAFLLFLGVVLSVEGHAEAHDAGVGLMGAMTGYITARLLGGTVQPGTAQAA
jgi:hypothetical protein